MLLLDTNAVLRLTLEREKLSISAQTAITSARRSQEPVHISVVSLWEIALLEAKKRVILQMPIERFLGSVEARFDVLPLTRDIAVAGVRLSKTYPKDPADRQIGATALVNGLDLVTADRQIRKSGEVRCIW